MQVFALALPLGGRPGTRSNQSVKRSRPTQVFSRLLVRYSPGPDFVNPPDSNSRFRSSSLPKCKTRPCRCGNLVFPRHSSADSRIGVEHMTQSTALEEEGFREGFFGPRSTFLSAGLNYALTDSAVVSKTDDCVTGVLSRARRWDGKIQRSESRAQVSVPLWLTSLNNPGVLELVSSENISRFGIRIVTQESWEAGELVLVSSPPGFCVHGSVAYCKKLPSDDHIVGIRFMSPAEQWRETLGDPDRS